MSPRPSIVLGLALLCGGAASAWAAEATSEQALQLLEARCFKCHSHSAGKNKGGLVLDVPAALLKGGDTGPALVAGAPEKSLLIEAVTTDDPDKKMPPKGDRLTATEVGLLRSWIKEGAAWPATRAKPASNRYLPGTIGAKERSWWAYQPVASPAVPAAAFPSTGDHPVDRFLDARLQAEGLTAAPAADRAALIRRLSYDVLGLPPTPEEVAAFVADRDPQAYEKLVDRLLTSPRYGERMARPWLDLVRYADSDGYRADDLRPTAWRYRDYVIRSYNENKPYDRFVQEQLAGDELFPGDPAALTATGYLRHWIYEWNQRDARGQWDAILDDLTDTTGDVFLGAGMQCARCHDHKFDPILQRDYFALRAFFANVQPVDDRLALTPADEQAYRVKFAEWERKSAEVRAAIAALEAPHRRAAQKEAVERFQDELQAMYHKPAAQRTALEEQLVGLIQRQVVYEWDRLDRRIKGEERTKLADLQKRLEALAADKPAEPPFILSVRETGHPAPAVPIPKKHVLVQPAFLSVLSRTVPAEPAAIAPPANGETSGRRATLARWLTDRSNPFTARLAMNRLWQLVFHRGLTPFASDFGRLGEPPSHPELLDYLATEFMARGWDQKAMHRLLLTSAAYRRSSTHPAPAAGLLKDPQGLLLWRRQPQRLEAEQVRDALFAAAGDLDLRRTAGPGANATDPVRSVYTRVLRNSRDPVLDVFDAPLWFSSASSRDITTTPVQSLLLLNSPFLLRRGDALAQRIIRDLPGADRTDERIQRLYGLLYGRGPTPAELARARAFLTQQARTTANGPAKATTGLVEEKIANRDGQAIAFAKDHAAPLIAAGTAGLDLSRGFTIEAVVVPRSVDDGATVRTIAALGSTDKTQPSWRFGITGVKSRRSPMVLVLQAFGPLRDGTHGEAVAFSGLRVEMNKPYFVSAAIKYASKDQPGEVTFSIKDLANDDEQLRSDTVASALLPLPVLQAPLSLGGEKGPSTRAYHGALDDVRFSNAPLPNAKLLFNSEDAAATTVGFWRFEGRTGLLKDSSGQGHDLSVAPAKGSGAAGAAQTTPKDPAFAALCHALLNSSEFLYLE
jgi:mono/diheme cytochrome c family protein